MAAKKDHTEAIKALHAIVIELALANRRRVKAQIQLLQEHIGDATDINEFLQPPVRIEGEGRGSHWAKRREAQQYLYTDEQNVEKTLSLADLTSLTKRSEKQLAMDFYKGSGQIRLSVKHPSSYGTMIATVTKL